jgi:hypothetical protein
MAKEKKKLVSEDTPVVVKKDPISVRIKNYFSPKGIQLEMLRYRPNKGSYFFSLLAIVCFAVGFCCFYSTTNLPVGTDKFNLFGSNVAGPWMGIDIVLNIVLMLFLFFATIKMKSYSLTMGYVSVGIGAFQTFRVFLLPLALLNADTMKPAIFITMLIMYVLSGTFAILAGFLSVYRGTALRKYLKTVKPIENEKVGK